MKVLIVDDSPDSLAVAKARLLKEGLEVITADCGQAGLDAARSELPDLILLDVGMPGISGFELCRRLKTDPDLSLIPVIFLTGSTSTADRVKGLDIGAIDYVTKPFDSFELRARIRAALRTKHLQDLLVQHARLDPLTELPNRRALDERLRQEFARIQRHGGFLSFIMADIDHFKQVNDTHGHSTGDRLLQLVAWAIADQCRRNDLPARFGGEEFAVVVPDEQAAGSFHLAERCRQAVQAVQLDLPGRSIRITASFGVADTANADDDQALIRAADQALYRAKQNGRNRVELAAGTTQSAHRC